MNNNTDTGRTFRVEVHILDDSELAAEELDDLAARAVLAIATALPGASAEVHLGPEREWGNLT